MATKRVEELKRRLEEKVDDLRLDCETAGALAPRCVGVAFAAFSPEVQVETAPEELAAADQAALEQEILSHLEAWESLPPQEFAERWEEYATDPYVGVGPHWVGLVDEDIVATWLESDELEEALRTHPPYSPRRVTLSHLQLTHLAPSRVLAAYRVKEEYENGNVTAGNTFAVLYRVADGWKIGVASKGTRHEAPIRQ